MTSSAAPTSVLVRPAHGGDADTLRLLAALDSAAPLTGEVLLAESDGQPVAAMSVDTGAVVADPFAPTADVVALLRVAARPAGRRGGRRAPRGLRLARAA
jgi:hypothetical protein